MDRDNHFDFFHYDKCDLCGECFYRCQYLKFNKKTAVEEMKKLIEGKPSKVLKKCISCNACNNFCPHGCRPYELITRRWHKRYRRNGLPVRAEYLMPSTTSNFRTDMVNRMSKREQELVETWYKTPPEGELVLYPGCNTLALPHLLDASFMEGVVIAGDWQHCCGEMFFRMGLYDEVKRTAEKLTGYYEDKSIGTMLFPCPACLNMFTNVLPEQFGAEFKFKTKYLGTYLLEKIEAGEIRIDREFNQKVTLHDSCHARILGEEVMEGARQILEYTGVEILEMELNKEEGLCCGIAAGANRYSPFDIVFSSFKELWQGQKTGAREFALYCGGCNITFNLCRWFFPTRQPIRHLLDYLKEACGESGYNPSQKRSKFMLFNILVKSFPRLLSNKTFWISRG